jgi:DNA-binding NarL/FixJ family response regulator
MIKVLIADDHAIVRKGLKEILAEASADTVVGEARNGEEALMRSLEEDWDVVILDISMPHLSGLQVLRQIKRARPHLPVLILSMHAEWHYVSGALRAGAAGYLNKETAPEELVKAIRVVIAGGTYYPTGAKVPHI